ncbi:hypothetical protein A2W14_07340 [Candidatus Gottesmanbacteria bacterium RBG_16_37_8]|uniref:Response regulatory domain-containing protein n=1 Tax=Candidatus Gottesmanbacteria bacterium RBG_16_37_8 TaxID=1798371 RepID=A0A1F5YRQ2_9BACT|nr:MAG: hypothetical protein A2W14_07340 [Candidatus Gottesmanbacteria bacterium RBG_16_37_8]
MNNILIIEDDPYVQRLYQRIFSHQKYNVEIAGSGREGLQKAHSFKPNLIFLDIMMPEMNGFDVLKALKENPDTKNIPVFMLTNFGQEENIKKAMEMGAEGILIKSDVPPDKLLKITEENLEKVK